MNFENEENIPELNINYEYQMIMIAVYRLCYFIENRRHSLLTSLFEIMPIEMELSIKNKMFNDTLKEIEYFNDNKKLKKEHNYKNEESRELKIALKGEKKVLEKYIKGCIN